MSIVEIYDIGLARGAVAIGGLDDPEAARRCMQHVYKSLAVRDEWKAAAFRAGFETSWARGLILSGRKP